MGENLKKGAYFFLRRQANYIQKLTIFTNHSIMISNFKNIHIGNIIQQTSDRKSNRNVPYL